MRALVGRAADPALQGALLERGIESIFMKLLDIALLPPPDDLAARLARAQGVLFTSANGVDALAAGATLRTMPVWTVGEATAQRAREAGFGDVHSAGGDVAALAATIRQRIAPGRGSLLYVRGSATAADLGDLLPDFDLDQVVLYRADVVARLSPQIAALLRQSPPDLALLFSPRSAAGFVSLVREAGLAQSCTRMTLVALSQAVAQAADVPWRTVHVAAHPSRAGLLAAIDSLRR